MKNIDEQSDTFTAKLRTSGNDTYEITIPKKIVELKKLQIGNTLAINIKVKQ
jgi:hypothetical protein